MLGTELAGEVDAVGRTVTRFSVGDQVFGFAGFRIGANADYICLPESASLERMPPGIGYEMGAAVVDGASTALFFLRDRAGLTAGQSVLVIGASGSIGTYAVQIARYLGAEVTGVCSTPNVDLVRGLGAHRVVDYTREDPFAARAAYDIVFDTVGKSSFAASRAALRPGGVYASTSITAKGLAQRAWTRWVGNRRVVGGMSVHKQEELRTIRELIESGVLRIVIDRTYSLSEIVKAHRYVDTGHKRGNVVVTVP